MVDSFAAKMGEDILLLDLAGLTLIADYFVIVTADTDRQLDALVTDLTTELKASHGIAPLHVEGSPSGGWVLVDLGAVVAHVFLAEQRAYYDLEELWNRARVVLRMA